MPKCLNDKTKTYKGNEPSPKGLGYCASAEEDGKIMEGHDNNLWKVKDPYVQEHINLVTGIRTGNIVNDAEAQVNSTLITIMARMSAYTGKDVTWEEVMNSDLYLGPKTYAFGPVPGIPETIPVIGAVPEI